MGVDYVVRASNEADIGGCRKMQADVHICEYICSAAAMTEDVRWV
jgi:hypothetical protein